MISRKLDGVRVITTYDNGTILFNSRTGLQFQTLDNLSDDAKKLIEILRQKTNEEYVLDGECCLFINDNQDDFSGIMKEITKKNHTIKNPRYVIFDAIKRKEFDAAVGTTPFKLRMKLLEEIFSENSFTNIALIPHADSIDKETYLE
jgi:ATP-dependent DNA ligase